MAAGCALIRWLLRGLELFIQMSHARAPPFVKYVFLLSFLTRVLYCSASGCAAKLTFH